MGRFLASAQVALPGEAIPMEIKIKTWGPFNGRQLTTIICVLAVGVLFPVGAWAAVSFTNVAITDPGGVNRAKVDATGKLAVGDGSGSLTVDGTVNERAALPTKPIVITPVAAGASFTTIYGPVSKAFAMGSLTLTNGCGGAQSFVLYSHTSPGGDFLIHSGYVGAQQTVHLTYPIPFVTTPPAGGTASLRAGSVAGCVSVSGVGYQT